MNIFIVMFGHLLLSLALVDVGILALPAEEEEDGALDEDFEEDVGHYDERKLRLMLIMNVWHQAFFFNPGNLHLQITFIYICIF